MAKPLDSAAGRYREAALLVQLSLPLELPVRRQRQPIEGSQGRQFRAYLLERLPSFSN